MPDVMVGIIALHPGAVAGDDAGRAAIAAGRIAAAEAVAGGERPDRTARAGARAFTVGSAIHRPRRRLGRQRPFPERGRPRVVPVVTTHVCAAPAAPAPPPPQARRTN